MITKSQALNLKYRDEILQISRLTGSERINYNGFGTIFVPDGGNVLLVNPVKWRVNGKIQTWKTRPDEFKISIKHGLYDYSYLTHENAHLFTLESEK